MALWEMDFQADQVRYADLETWIFHLAVSKEVSLHHTQTGSCHSHELISYTSAVSSVLWSFQITAASTHRLLHLPKLSLSSDVGISWHWYSSLAYDSGVTLKGQHQYSKKSLGAHDPNTACNRFVVEQDCLVLLQNHRIMGLVQLQGTSKISVSNHQPNIITAIKPHPKVPWYKFLECFYEPHLLDLSSVPVPEHLQDEQLYSFWHMTQRLSVFHPADYDTNWALCVYAHIFACMCAQKAKKAFFHQLLGSILRGLCQVALSQNHRILGTGRSLWYHPVHNLCWIIDS